VKNAIKKLEKLAPKDLIISIFILILIIVSYLFNLYHETLKTKEILSQEYILTGKYYFYKMTLKEIDNLPNISHKLAKDIYENRKMIKKFDDFGKIKGIGKKKIEILKKYLILQ
jgi:hypothetical protein